MDGFDPRTSFGDEESRRYDATDSRGDEPETVAFLARLAAGRDALEFAIGTGRTYGLVYLVYNTIGNIITQDGQVQCFANVARHLADDGVFVLECRMPAAPGRLGRQFVAAQHIAAGRVVLEAGRYDPVTQVLDQTHIHLTPDGIELGPAAAPGRHRA